MMPIRFTPIRSTAVLALVLASLAPLVPSVALASPRAEARRARREARVSKRDLAPRGCVKAPVQVIAAARTATLSLAKCDGAAAPGGLERLSALARARGSVRLDARLVEQLELAVDHFRKGVDLAKVELVSGYRPESSGSYHAKGRALDFKLEGVPNEALVAFCKTLPDTGCGYYPNSGFVHMDVREPGTGHIAWTDVSRPGQAPHYVTGVAAATGATGVTGADDPSDAPPAATLPALPPHHRTAKREAASRAVADNRLHSI